MPRQKPPAPKPKADIKSYIQNCIKDISKTDYFQKRGLSDETIQRFSLGYDAVRKAVVIPYNKRLDYYQSRSVIDKQFFKPKTEDAGQEPLFNADVLKDTKSKFIAIVESPICEISIIQCGGQAVAICGANGWKKLINALPKNYKGTFIISLDNDDPGQKAAKDLAAELLERNIKYIVTNISDDFKDPNELLMANSIKLTRNIKTAVAAAKKRYSTSERFSAVELQTTKLDEPKWIVKDVLPQGLV